MKYQFAKMLAATAMAFSIQAALADDSPKMAKGILVDAAGRTLYTFDVDRDGKSSCNGRCTMYWPPALATGTTPSSRDLSIFVREDGTDQWAFQGMPLYRFSGDTQPGDVNGDDRGGAWHAIRSPLPRASRSVPTSPNGH